MNILLTNDDGAKAYGLKVLAQAVSSTFETAKIVILTTAEAMVGQGMAISPVHLLEIPVEEREPGLFVCKARPVDLVYLALQHPERFVERGRFDLVVTGVNHGQNVGMDVFHSGTVGMAMLASTSFGISAVAFSQALDDFDPDGSVAEPKQFSNAERHAREFFRRYRLSHRSCWNVNFPVATVKGWKTCDVAPSSWFRPPAHVRPALRETHDIRALDRGYITVSRLKLRVNPRAK